MADITFKHVVKTYDKGNTVVPDLNLEIKDKEFVVLVGPSGCGKSTTLRMIAGLEEVSGGELYIGDRKVNDVPPKDRDIAMVFQSYALYPHMTVYKNMAFALELRKVPKDEIDKKVREAAKILGLEEYLKRKPKELSGGQRQRVALGRAMVRQPAVFLLDEPLSNLDAKLRTEMRSQIAALHKRLQTTFVYVTHDQTEAMTMGDRIVVMKDGVIQQFDTPQMLPICPTSYGDSPYQSFSAYAGNPYFIDLEMLESAGYLEAEDYKTVDWESAPDHVNYGALYQKRYPILRKAVRRFQETASDDYEAFCRQNDYWLHDYASFMALKAASGGKAWMDWEPALRNREQKALEHAAAAYKEEIEFWKSLQYLFFEQWKALREYANEAGLQIIGDLPIYVSLDSVDVWAHPELFQLDENKVPREVAGCPPDGFSADGQLWGNPLFDWDYM